MSVSILVGDCREVLATMPDESVHCVVTSPPYWGLRDYGTAKWEGGDPDCKHRVGGQVEDGKAPGAITTGQRPGVDASRCRSCGAQRLDSQLGLELTPDEYVAGMVEVFRDVRRVLRADGTLWLNLGSSYAAAPKGNPGVRGNINGGKRDGSSDPMHGVRAARGLRLGRARACGTDGKGLQDSTIPDSACSDLCGECRAALSMDSVNISRQLASGASPLSQTARDSEPEDSSPTPASVSPRDAPASTSEQFAAPPLAECSHCGNCGACLAVLDSSSRDASLCVRKALYTSGTDQIESAGRNQGKNALGMAWLNYTFKPKDMVPIPWMVAMALQADGWWLRQDIIWSKPNPMPESVRDRCTKAHEYLFLLSKSERYYYDADAIAEDRVGTGDAGVSGWASGDTPHDAVSHNRQKGDAKTFRGGQYVGSNKFDNSHATKRDSTGNKPAEKDTKNRRSVWTIPSMPFGEAHFATFPPALIEPCIMAGCPEGGTVLDPFGGAGTTGLVADRHHRNAILIELNPEYAAMAERRIRGESPLFSQVTQNYG